jgi:hypothetical protein
MTPTAHPACVPPPAFHFKLCRMTLNLRASNQPIAEAIARAANHLNDLRENWLNPPEWTLRLPDKEILRPLLALNLQRAKAQDAIQ